MERVMWEEWKVLCVSDVVESMEGVIWESGRGYVGRMEVVADASMELNTSTNWIWPL